MIIIVYGYFYSFEKVGIRGWHVALCLFVLVVIALGSLAKEQVIPWNSGELSDWLQWKTVGAAVYALMVGTLSAATIIQLLDPKDTPGELVLANRNAARAAANTNRIMHGMSRAGLMSSADAVLSSGLPGVWGERGCQVTYQVAVHETGMTMQSLKDVAGLEPFRQVLRLAPARASADGSVSAMAEIVDGPDVGSTVVLGYEKIAGIERLVRDQKAPQRTMTLDRCPK